MKVYAITLGFCPWRVLEAGIKSYYETASFRPDAHYFLDQHYPLRREENLERIKSICEQYRLTFVDSGSDRGMCGGFNFLMEQIPCVEGDILIGYDPDSRPEQGGWDRACLEVLAAEPGLDMVVAAQSFTNEHIYPLGIIKGGFQLIAGQLVFYVEMPTHDMWTIGAFRFDLVKGRKLSSRMAYWGGTEGLWVNWMIERGKTYGILLDYQENNGHSHLGDPEYRKYKDALIADYAKSFAEYLKGE